MAERSRKRLFIGLLSGASLLVILFLALLWWVPYVGFEGIHPWAKWIVGSAVLVLMILVGWSVLGLVLNIWLGRSMPCTQRLRGVTVKLVLPLMTLLGRSLGISKEHVRNSFVNVNNQMVLAEGKKYQPDEMLLLMPHCLQSSLCTRRLTYNINNCKRCGKCPIAGLLHLHDRYGVHLAIATGGTIARRIVVQKRPKLIIAVACERDLASGIQDTYPLPVYGVLNERPHGPCLDTTVPLDTVEAAIRIFLNPQFYPAPAAGSNTTPGRSASRGKTIATGQAARHEHPAR